MAVVEEDISAAGELVRDAMLFAKGAHTAIGQTRKYTGSPYIEHPAAVVKILEGVASTPTMLAAAWLHDVVEDTHVSLETIAAEFGAEVAALVDALTEPAVSSHVNRAARKGAYRVKMGDASPEAKTIKLADILDNTATIVEHDPKFARTYLSEITNLLRVLSAGDAVLYDRACEQVGEAYRRIVGPLLPDVPRGMFARGGVVSHRASAAPWTCFIHDQSDIAAVREVVKTLAEQRTHRVVVRSDAAGRSVVEIDGAEVSGVSRVSYELRPAPEGRGFAVVHLEIHSDVEVSSEFAESAILFVDQKRIPGLGEK